MFFTFYNNKLKGKFYEINRIKNKNIYIHYGSMPRARSLPMGKFEIHKFINREQAKKYMESKIHEKIQKKYELGNKQQTQIFKWMLKNAKPSVKNKTTKKKKTDSKKNKTKKGGRK